MLSLLKRTPSTTYQISAWRLGKRLTTPFSSCVRNTLVESCCAKLTVEPADIFQKLEKAYSEKETDPSGAETLRREAVEEVKKLGQSMDKIGTKSKAIWSILDKEVISITEDQSKLSILDTQLMNKLEEQKQSGSIIDQIEAYLLELTKAPERIQARIAHPSSPLTLMVDDRVSSRAQTTQWSKRSQISRGSKVGAQSLGLSRNSSESSSQAHGDLYRTTWAFLPT